MKPGIIRYENWHAYRAVTSVGVNATAMGMDTVVGMISTSHCW